jgi:hypothetical protein
MILLSHTHRPEASLIAITAVTASRTRLRRCSRLRPCARNEVPTS